eukprot:m.33436 g.33436  ORF g.33436 m.33436 type:complete len:616 (-) comp10393_c0_seq1:53-1900(-)
MLLASVARSGRRHVVATNGVTAGAMRQSAWVLARQPHTLQRLAAATTPDSLNRCCRALLPPCQTGRLTTTRLTPTRRARATLAGTQPPVQARTALLAGQRPKWDASLLALCTGFAPACRLATFSSSALSPSPQTSEPTTDPKPKRRGRPPAKVTAASTSSADTAAATNKDAPPTTTATSTPATTPRLAYSLRAADLEAAPKLADELSAFRNFLTVKFFGQQEPRVRPATAQRYLDTARGVLGWLHHERGVALDDLSLASVFPSTERAAVEVSFDYVQWLSTRRRLHPSTEAQELRGLLQVAKFLYHSKSHADPAEGDKPYGDLLVVRELRKLGKDAMSRAAVAKPAYESNGKWLDWPVFLDCVARLRAECDQINQQLASATSIAERAKLLTRKNAWKQQTHLLFSVLSCVPDRQRTLRELEVGRTLVQDPDHGSWYISHGPDDYKTGKVYGERPPMPLLDTITPYLDDFLVTWRPLLQPNHRFLFTKKNGHGPLTSSGLYQHVRLEAFRQTGQKTNPHLLRDSVVTYLRGTEATERELEALAIFMGHSVAMQKSSYDRRTKKQKVKPAIDLLSRLQEGVGEVEEAASVTGKQLRAVANKKPKKRTTGGKGKKGNT